MIHSFFDQPEIDLPGLSSFLDRLDPEVRVAAVRTLSGKQQARLFEAAQPSGWVHRNYLAK